jgi:hypothetical protein
MEQYGFLVDSDTGVPIDNIGFKESEFPSTIPSHTMLVKFNQSTPDFEKIYAMFFGDPNRLTVDLLLPHEGGVVYNKSNNTFTFTEIDWSINIEEFKKVRNNMITSTDKYMLLPDLPQNLKDEIVSYRQQLRDITKKVGTEWKTVHDINWPTPPSFTLPEVPNVIPMPEN